MATNSFVKKVADMVAAQGGDDECPLPLSVIPNHMGINLCSVDSVSWERQEDGQLVSLTIHFTPTTEEERVRRDFRPAAETNTGAIVRCVACDGVGENPSGDRCQECGGKGCVCTVCKSTATSTPHVRASRADYERGLP